MSFVEEINNLLGFDASCTDMYVTFVVSKGVVVQGYKKLLEINDTRLVVLGKNKQKLAICGNSLEVFSLAPSEIVVHGKVSSVGEVDD